MDLFFICVSCYLIGAIPFGFILTKIFLKKDIRDLGSGNIGATNALRTGNKLLGYGTLFFDIFKAIIPLIYIKYNYLDFIYIASLCVFIGHIFPIWLKFKGGKGVAAYLGILLTINFSYGCFFILVWLIVFLIYKYSSLSSLISSFCVPVYLLILNKENLIFFSIMFVLILYTHRKNIKRLKNKEENKSKIY